MGIDAVYAQDDVLTANGYSKDMKLVKWTVISVNA